MDFERLGQFKMLRLFFSDHCRFRVRGNEPPYTMPLVYYQTEGGRHLILKKSEGWVENLGRRYKRPISIRMGF